MKALVKVVVFGLVVLAALLFMAAPASALVDVAGWHAVFEADVDDYGRATMDLGRVVWASYESSRGGELRLHDLAQRTTSLVLSTELNPMFPSLHGDQIAFWGIAQLGGQADTGIYLYTLSSRQLQKLSATGWQGEQLEFSGDVVAWMEIMPNPEGVPYRRLVFHRVASGETRILAESVPPDDHLSLSLVSDDWILWRTYPSEAERNLVAYSVKTGIGRVFEELRYVTPEFLEGDVLYYTPRGGGPWQLRARDLATGNDSLVLENSQPIQSVYVEGQRVAYASWDPAGSYVAILDRVTRETTRIYSPAYQVGGLVLCGDLVLWRGERTFFANSPGAYLFVYDRSDGTVTRLSRIQSYTHAPDTDGQAVLANESHYRPGYFASDLTVAVRQPMSSAGIFPDVSYFHPYWTAVKGLGEAGAVGGFPGQDGMPLFRPGASLTRGQFAKMLVEALDIPTSGDYLSTLVDLGILKGDARGRLNPYGSLARAQLISLVVRATDKFRPGLLADSEIDRRPSTIGLFDPVHALNLRRAEWGGLLDGLVGFGRGWNPWQAASRGEAAQVLWNLASAES